MSSARDGTSNTIALGEARRPTSLQDIAAVYNYSPVGMSMPELTALWTRREYVNTNDHLTTNAGGIQRGHHFACGEPRFIGFSTVLPPNSGNFANSGDSDANAWVLGSVSSNHSGGANSARLDGSVSFITNSINTGTETGSRRLPDSTNTADFRDLTGSQWGVWGALGTANGGESVSL